MSLTTASALYELGKSLALQGNIKDADTKFQMAIAEILRTEEEDKDMLYICYKARLDINMENEAERTNISTVMLDAFSQDEDYKETVLYDLAQCHKVSGDKARYVNALEQIINQFKTPQPFVYFELGLMQQDNKELDKAVKNYLSYLNIIGKKHGNTQITALNLASCYNAVAQPERAQQVLKRYLNIQ